MMGLFDKLLAPAAGSVVKDIGSAVGTLAKDIRTAITGVDPAAQAELEKLALQADQLANQAQTDVNKIEAQSPSLFVSGWRPAIGWVCALILFAAYIVLPILKASGLQNAPKIEMGDLWPVLMGLLGLGGLRTYEKVKGASGRH